MRSFLPQYESLARFLHVSPVLRTQRRHMSDIPEQNQLLKKEAAFLRGMLARRKKSPARENRLLKEEVAFLEGTLARWKQARSPVLAQPVAEERAPAVARPRNAVASRIINLMVHPLRWLFGIAMSVGSSVRRLCEIIFYLAVILAPVLLALAVPLLSIYILYSYVSGGCMLVSSIHSGFTCQCSKGYGYRMETCHACTSGTFSLGGQQSCKPCLRGFSSAWGADKCTPCPPGEYQPLEGQPSCKWCDEGKYSTIRGSTICLSCEPGHHANGKGRQQCDQCAPGEYQSLPGEARCKQCDEGKYSSIRGAAICLSCEPGHHANGKGRLECDACAPGEYQSLPGQANCTACAAGKHSVSAEAPACVAWRQVGECHSDGRRKKESRGSCTESVPAEANGYCDCGSLRERVPVPCEAHVQQFSPAVSKKSSSPPPRPSPPPRLPISRSIRFTCQKACSLARSTHAGSTRCEPCRKGWFAPAGQYQCDPCPEGTYQPEVGQSSCIPCEMGTKATGSGSTNCEICEPGSFAPTRSSHTCYSCPEGKHQPHPGQSTCKCCPDNTWSGGSASQCTSCSTLYVSIACSGRCVYAGISTVTESFIRRMENAIESFLNEFFDGMKGSFEDYWGRWFQARPDEEKASEQFCTASFKAENGRPVDKESRWVIRTLEQNHVFKTWRTCCSASKSECSEKQLKTYSKHVYLQIHPDKFTQAFGCPSHSRSAAEELGHKLTVWFHTERNSCGGRGGA